MRSALLDIAPPDHLDGQRLGGFLGDVDCGLNLRLSLQPGGVLGVLAIKFARVGLLVYEDPQAVRLSTSGFNSPGVRAADGATQGSAQHFALEHV
jgi:hypothetical protein